MDLDDLLMMKGVLDVNWRTLDIRWTLFNGQSFRWMKRASSNEQHMIAVGVVGPYVLELSQNLQPTSITGDHDDKPKQSRSMKRSPADSSNRKIRDSIGSIKRSRSSEDDAETGENETAAKKQKLDRKSSNEVDQRVHWRLLNPLTCQQIKKDCQPNVLKDLIQQRLHTYFQLEVDLEELYREWCEKDPVFKKLSEKYSGVRIMQQDLTENLFSFICSSNNNIQRIGVLVRSLAMIYGRFLYHDCELGKFFQFPNIKDLSVSDKNYSVQGFGYRSKFIANAVRHLKLLNARNPESYLVNLRDNLSYQEARKKLITEISGAGQKVSDCICLMSLKKHEAIPVDTHIFQVAIEHYNFNSSGNKSGKAALSFAQYNQIAKFFQDLHGKYAGWAQSVLFSSHIKKLA